MCTTRTTLMLVLMLATAISSGANPASADDKPFMRTTIDVGVVVSNVDRAVEFYTKAIGFKEIDGFAVDGKTLGNAGLTDSQPLKVRVLVLGDDETATKLKLMEVPGVETKKSDNQFIHSQFGYSYLTVFVADTNAAMARLKQAGVKPLAKGPAALPESLAPGVFLTCVRDPDGNILELVGPKK